MSTQQSDLGSGQPITALPDSGTPLVKNGVTTLAQATDVQSAYSGNTITPTASFSFPWNGQTLQFRVGQSVEVEAALHTALTAAGAPFNTP